MNDTNQIDLVIGKFVSSTDVARNLLTGFMRRQEVDIENLRALLKGVRDWDAINDKLPWDLANSIISALEIVDGGPMSDDDLKTIHAAADYVNNNFDELRARIEALERYVDARAEAPEGFAKAQRGILGTPRPMVSRAAVLEAVRAVMKDNPLYGAEGLAFNKGVVAAMVAIEKISEDK